MGHPLLTHLILREVLLDELTAVTVLYLFESAGDRLLSVRSLHGGEAVCCPLVGRSCCSISFVTCQSGVLNHR